MCVDALVAAASAYGLRRDLDVTIKGVPRKTPYGMRPEIKRLCNSSNLLPMPSIVPQVYLASCGNVDAIIVSAKVRCHLVILEGILMPREWPL